MNAKLPLPYAEHLAFKNSDGYRLSSDYGFNEAYASLQLAAQSSGAFTEQKERVIQSLNKIFDQLAPQATEHREKLFIADLRRQMMRILAEDLGVFFRRSKANDYPANGQPHNFDEVKYRLFSEQKFLQGRIPKEAVDKINRMISSLVVKFRENARKGKTKREELSQNTGMLNRRVVNVLNNAFRKNGILNIVSKYMAEDTVVSGVAIELSVPNANWWKVDYTAYDRPPKTLYFHFDESIAKPKSIVYLTDVNEKTGATSCAPTFLNNAEVTPLQHLAGRAITVVGRESNPELMAHYDHKYHQTFGCPTFRKDYSRLPDQLRFSSHFGWDVIPNSQLESFLLTDEKKIVGPAGTFIAFDGGFLAHRGGLIQEGDRVALQVVFDKKMPLIKRAFRKAKRLVFRA
jgi:hypothetical protein